VLSESAQRQPGPSAFRGTQYHTRYKLGYEVKAKSGYPISNPILEGFCKPDSTLNIWLCGHIRLFLIPIFFRQKLGIPQAECLVLDHSMQFEQEYSNTTNLRH
jgi:hypothetical protein